MRALVPEAIKQLEHEIEGKNGWKVALEIIKIAEIKSGHIREIGHDNPDKILK